MSSLEILHKIIYLLPLICITITDIRNIQGSSLKEIIKMYQLVEPFQIPNRTKINDLEDIRNCECPRVYWPACATDNTTFVNACILNCMKKTLRRLGPCITYRRANNRKMIILIPSVWKVSNFSN